MVRNKKVVVVLPAYNAEKTLITTYREIPFDIVDEVILVDDASIDHTVESCEESSYPYARPVAKNLGYGGNQKSCYRGSS